MVVESRHVKIDTRGLERERFLAAHLQLLRPEGEVDDRGHFRQA